VRPRWLLEEIGAPYELVRVNLDAEEQKRPEYLAINPNGTVPTLVDDGLTIYESAAICEYLADKYPDARLAPGIGTPERGLYYQWMHYSMTSLDAQVITILHHTTYKPEAERLPALVAESREQLASSISVLDRALAGRRYLFDSFGAADVMIGSGLIWAQRLGAVEPERKAVLAYVARLVERPAFRRAIAD
jgi:glutathione S-transferase